MTKAPFMALTASAPAEVEAEIFRSLHFSNPVRVLGNLDRPKNTVYSIMKKSNMHVSLLCSSGHPTASRHTDAGDRLT